VTIGGVKVENQTVELANAVSQSFVQDANTDGLVGLAFSSLNTVNDGTKKTPAKTFFDNVMGSLDLPYVYPYTITIVTDLLQRF
jgi:hypothetical protein